MFPHEVQELLAKLLFILFSITILCFSKVRAEDISFYNYNTPSISKTNTTH